MSQDITIWVVFRIKIAKTPSYAVMCPFPLIVALQQHYRQTDGQTSCL